MDKRSAISLIRDTLENSFDKRKFAYLVSNMLDHIEAAPFIYRGNLIPDAYEPYISTLERIGKYKDREGNKIDLLIVRLKKETSLERARTMQRNFIAWYLNGSRGDILKDAALAAFISPDTEDWRFSLVKMDYRLDTSGEKVKVKKELTPARRFSFLVGRNENSHTAQSRLVSMLADDKHNPTLKEIEKAFDIETVTKEFFLKYRELFLHTKEELDRVVEKDSKVDADFKAKGVDTVNFAKKLLGQIIFLYFLQKKGWFGVGRDDDWDTGSKHFLRELFGGKHGDYNNFFNDILEPLFYDALRNDRSHDDGYYSRFNCKIPFLNGGLFDPIGNYDWVHTDILLPNKLFSNQTRTKEGDAGTGILDVFDRYNFTVKEDEPLEKEVAIDPELLGKSYEKFNAIRPDNFAEFKKALKSGRKGEENKFNKKFGVYYTPREIVHYMCQQSLINYLATELSDSPRSVSRYSGSISRHSGESRNPVPSKEDIEALIHTGEQFGENEAIFLKKEQKIKKGEQKTTSIKLKLSDNIRKNAKLIDDKLAEITVCDPAVGSGAFPVGMMSEIVKARNVLSIFLNDKNRKTYNFKRQCIERSLYGVDIDPGAVEIAKLRLWLSLVVDEDDIKNIKPLPNLDYRIMQGNSLISEFMGISFDEDENKNLKQNIDDLGIEIKELDKQIKDKEKEFLRYYNRTKNQDQNLSNKLDELVNRKNDLKKNQTQLIKKLNNPQNEDPEIIDIISEFQKKKNTFLNESNVTRKSQLKNEVDDLLVKIFETKLRTQKPDYFNRLKNIENKYSVIRNEKQRDELVKQDKEKLNKKFGFDPELAEKQLKEFTSGRKIKPFFLWNLYFSEVFLSGAKSASGGHNKGGFDVVIANPPYVRHEGIKPLKLFLAKEFQKFYCSTADIYTYFYKRGLDLLKSEGCLCFIAPNKFMRATYGKNTRQLLTNKGTPRFIIDFCDLPIFDATTYPAILLIEKNEPDADEKTLVTTFCRAEQLERIEETIANLGFRIPVAGLKSEGWCLEKPRVLALMEKIRGVGKPLGEYVNGRFYYGIKTGLNEAFVIDATTRERLIDEDPAGGELIKPWLRGRDIRKWKVEWAGLYFINIPSTVNKKWPWSDAKTKDAARQIFEQTYPAIHRHLSHWEKRLKKRDDQGKFWWELRSCAYYKEFEQSKITWGNLATEPKFAFDTTSSYVSAPANIIPIEDLYLLAILNSPLCKWMIALEAATRSGGFLEYKPMYVGKIPIFPALKIQKAPIIERVRTILENSDRPDMLNLKAEINTLIFDLYDLTVEEIAIVEEGVKR